MRWLHAGRRVMGTVVALCIQAPAALGCMYFVVFVLFFFGYCNFCHEISSP